MIFFLNLFLNFSLNLFFPSFCTLINIKVQFGKYRYIDEALAQREKEEDNPLPISLVILKWNIYTDLTET